MSCGILESPVLERKVGDVGNDHPKAEMLTRMAIARRRGGG